MFCRRPGSAALSAYDFACRRRLSVIEGLINLRGQIVTAIDMRRRLRLPRPNRRHAANEYGGPHLGRRSQSVWSTRSGMCWILDAATYERPPENLDAGRARELIRGVYKLKDRLLLVLDAERTVDLTAGRAA
jgi:purine-binding chemotaxis protein CheW